MKATTIGWEMTISLSKEEIGKLSESPLEGKVKVYDGDINLGLRDIEVKIGNSKEQLSVDIETEPPNKYVIEVERYKVIVTSYGYEELKSRGMTGDRINHSIKVSIYDEVEARKNFI